MCWFALAISSVRFNITMETGACLFGVSRLVNWGGKCCYTE